MSTLCYIIHDNMDNSSSQQFLLASGKAMTQVTYVDLQNDSQRQNGFDPNEEWNRLSQYDRIIFQFPLFWYQAPALLKQWIDQVFDETIPSSQWKEQLKGKELGLVVVVGSPARDYRRGTKLGVTLSELLAPYQAFANFFEMIYLPAFEIYQFHYSTEAERYQLLIDYSFYLDHGRIPSLKEKAHFIYQHLRGIQLNLPPRDQYAFEQLLDTMLSQADEITEIKEMLEL